jgi:hypothetical protein
MVHPHVLDQYGTWQEGYLWEHLEHISRRPDLWYVALGHLYLYTLVRERLETPAAVAGDVKTLPGSIGLLQNYPNPFNPATRIRYALSVAGEVRLVVLDLLGREVAVLENGRREAGVHDVEWNGSSQASGVYVARLTSGQAIRSHRMLLVR